MRPDAFPSPDSMHSVFLSERQSPMQTRNLDQIHSVRNLMNPIRGYSLLSGLGVLKKGQVAFTAARSAQTLLWFPSVVVLSLVQRIL